MLLFPLDFNKIITFNAFYTGNGEHQFSLCLSVNTQMKCHRMYFTRVCTVFQDKNIQGGYYILPFKIQICNCLICPVNHPEFILSYDVACENDIMTCIKIDKPLMVNLLSNVMQLW